MFGIEDPGATNEQLKIICEQLSGRIDDALELEDDAAKISKIAQINSELKAQAETLV